ncbi:hypothetical protein CFP56_035334, partial [Quercus suber]
VTVSLVLYFLAAPTHTKNLKNSSKDRIHFYLAGNPEDEFQQQGRSPRGSRRHQQEQGQGRCEGQGKNFFSGFSTKDLAEVFYVNEDTIRNLQGLQLKTGAT